MLPGIDGMEICRQIRNRYYYTSILILMSKSSELDHVLGLEMSDVSFASILVTIYDDFTGLSGI